MEGTSRANIINASCISCGLRPRLRRGKELPNNSKKQIWGPFFPTQTKTWLPKCWLFLFFYSPRRSQTLKIEPKRCKSVQKRGCHFFIKKRFFFYKKCPTMTSLGTSKTHRKLKKTEKGASRNGAEKNTQNKHSKWTCLSNGTGSAFKRRARAKWIPENSQNKTPRTKTRKHHRKNAKTLQK